MTHSIHHQALGNSASAALSQPVQPVERGGYGALAAAAFVDELIPISYAEDSGHSSEPARHESFDVTVAHGADTQGQLDRALALIRRQLPEDKYVIQEINVRGTVFTGGDPADLDHNRRLARRNEDYVHQYLILADVRPELQGQVPRHVLAPQAQSDTEHNAVRVDVVYRKRSEDEMARARGLAVRNPRCSKRSGAAPDVDGPRVWLRRCAARQHA